jgi:hypothetical protein
VLLLVVSETGLVYTFTTPKLQPLVTKPEGKNLIQVSRHISMSEFPASLTCVGLPQCPRTRRREWRGRRVRRRFTRGVACSGTRNASHAPNQYAAQFCTTALHEPAGSPGDAVSGLSATTAGNRRLPNATTGRDAPAALGAYRFCYPARWSTQDGGGQLNFTRVDRLHEKSSQGGCTLLSLCYARRMALLLMVREGTAAYCRG